MKKIIVLLFAFVLSVFAQELDTNKVQIKTDNIETKVINKISTTPLLELRIKSELNNLGMYPNSMIYSDMFAGEYKLGLSNDLYSQKNVMLNPLIMQLNNKPSFINQVLTYATYGAVAYMAGAHLKKYWKEYKKDFFGGD